MRPGIEGSSTRESSSLAGILCELLYRFGGVMLTVMYSVTGWVDRAVSPTSFSRTQGISAREMFNESKEREFLTKRTTLRGYGYPHLMGPYNDVGMCRPTLGIKLKSET